MQAALHRVGGWATRLLLGPRLRRQSWSRELYLRLYLLAKAVAERRQRAFMRSLVEAGDVVFDIGANVGSYSRLFARAVGPAGRVHAFEPDPLACTLLRRSCRGLGNVEIHEVAAGENDGTAVLYCSRVNRADNRLHDSHLPSEGGEERVEVAVVPLDQYCTARGMERLDVVKIDVQGFETAVLRGSRGSLRRLRPRHLLIELSPRHLRGAGSSAAELFALLDAMGYDAWTFGSPVAAPIADPAAFAARVADGYTDVWARRAPAGG